MILWIIKYRYLLSLKNSEKQWVIKLKFLPSSPLSCWKECPGLYWTRQSTVIQFPANYKKAKAYGLLQAYEGEIQAKADS